MHVTHTLPNGKKRVYHYPYRERKTTDAPTVTEPMARLSRTIGVTQAADCFSVRPCDIVRARKLFPIAA